MGFFHQGTLGMPLDRHQVSRICSSCLVPEICLLICWCLIHEAEKTSHFFQTVMWRYELKDESRYYFMIQLPWLTGLHKYETHQKKVIPKKEAKTFSLTKVMKKRKSTNQDNQGGAQSKPRWPNNEQMNNKPRWSCACWRCSSTTPQTTARQRCFLRFLWKWRVHLMIWLKRFQIFT